MATSSALISSREGKIAGNIPMERAKPEPDAASMPTTAEIILQAAAVLAPVLPVGFYGKAVIIYENGRPLRMVKEESIKLQP